MKRVKLALALVGFLVIPSITYSQWNRPECYPYNQCPSTGTNPYYQGPSRGAAAVEGFQKGFNQGLACSQAQRRTTN